MPETGTPASEFRRAEPTPTHGARVDPSDQFAFLRRYALSPGDGFVHAGGGKLKLLLGGPGAGKTHALRTTLGAAADEGFLVAYVDARGAPLWGFDHLYGAIAQRIDLVALARRFAASVLNAMNYGPYDPTGDGGRRLAEWAEAHGHDRSLLRVKWDEALQSRLLRDPNLDYGYALGWVRWCDSLLWGDPGPGGGGPEAAAGWSDGAGMIEHWLRGGKVAARDCNRLRLRRSIDRFTARGWLRSLLHVVRAAGAPGLAVGVDNLDVVLATRPRGSAPAGLDGHAAAPSEAADVHYTPLRRSDLYECLRALIDDMGLLPGLLVTLAATPETLSDGKRGIASYNALDYRLRNEIETVEVNRFADEIVLERLWAADAAAGRALVDALLAQTPEAGPEVRERALAAAQAEWSARGVTVSAVRRSVLAVLQLAGRLA